MYKKCKIEQSEKMDPVRLIIFLVSTWWYRGKKVVGAVICQDIIFGTFLLWFCLGEFHEQMFKINLQRGLVMVWTIL